MCRETSLLAWQLTAMLLCMLHVAFYHLQGDRDRAFSDLHTLEPVLVLFHFKALQMQFSLRQRAKTQQSTMKTLSCKHLAVPTCAVDVSCSNSWWNCGLKFLPMQPTSHWKESSAVKRVCYDINKRHSARINERLNTNMFRTN